MTTAQAYSLVKSMRRQTALSKFLRIVLAIVFCLTTTSLLSLPVPSDERDLLRLLALLCVVAWFGLTAMGARSVPHSNRAAMDLAAGRLDLAEDALASGLRTFSLYRQAQLMLCHNLAVVLHAQKNFAAAAILCDAVILIHPRATRGLGRVCRILLADCRLWLGDIEAAAAAIEPLLLRRNVLHLNEQLMLLPVELRCRVAQRRYRDAAADLTRTVRLAEMLDSPRAALVHALLALCEKVLGRQDSADRLLKRSQLYHEFSDLRKDFPVLADLPAPAAAHGPSTSS